MKHFFSILLMSSIFILNSYSVEATNSNFKSPNGKTRVRGNVYDLEAGNWVQGVTVAVTCNGKTLSSSTSNTGLYVVDFNKSECPKFAMVSAAVTYEGETLGQTVQVSNMNTATMDFNFGAAAVPELGMITGLMAAGGSGIVYLGMKRKNFVSFS